MCGGGGLEDGRLVTYPTLKECKGTPNEERPSTPATPWLCPGCANCPRMEDLTSLMSVTVERKQE